MHIFYRPQFMISASDTYLTFNKCFIIRDVAKVRPILISRKKIFFSEIYYLVVLSIIIQVASQKHLEMYRISEERGDFYFSRKLHFEDCILGTYYLVVFHISDGK